MHEFSKNVLDLPKLTNLPRQYEGFAWISLQNCFIESISPMDFTGMTGSIVR